MREAVKTSRGALVVVVQVATELAHDGAHDRRDPPAVLGPAAVLGLAALALHEPVLGVDAVRDLVQRGPVEVLDRLVVGGPAVLVDAVGEELRAAEGRSVVQALLRALAVQLDLLAVLPVRAALAVGRVGQQDRVDLAQLRLGEDRRLGERQVQLLHRLGFLLRVASTVAIARVAVAVGAALLRLEQAEADAEARAHLLGDDLPGLRVARIQAGDLGVEDLAGDLGLQLLQGRPLDLVLVVRVLDPVQLFGQLAQVDLGLLRQLGQLLGRDLGVDRVIVGRVGVLPGLGRVLAGLVEVVGRLGQGPWPSSRARRGPWSGWPRTSSESRSIHAA